MNEDRGFDSPGHETLGVGWVRTRSPRDACIWELEPGMPLGICSSGDYSEARPAAATGRGRRARGEGWKTKKEEEEEEGLAEEAGREKEVKAHGRGE